jgi:hypothetical protein
MAGRERKPKRKTKWLGVATMSMHIILFASVLVTLGMMFNQAAPHIQTAEGVWIAGVVTLAMAVWFYKVFVLDWRE